MDAISIIEVFNKTLEDKGSKAHLILQKTKESCTVKAFKEHTWTVWYIVDGKKYQLTCIVHVAREVTEKEELHNISALEEELLKRLFNDMSDSALFNSLVDGSFKGFGI